MNKSSIACLCLAATLIAARAQAGTPETIASGQRMFDHGCTSCHDDTGYMVKGDGPALFGVVGRQVGSVEGYVYSPALRQANQDGDVWTARRLETFLANPGHMYPGTTMPWSFSARDDRLTIIAYLKSLKPPKATR